MLTNLMLLAGGLVISFQLEAQHITTLEVCTEEAIKHFPVTAQVGLVLESSDLKMKNLNKNFFPDLYLNGQLHYQSDVTKVPIQEIPIFGVEQLDKDWYKINLDVNQAIFDGGITRQQKNLEEIDREINLQNIDIEHQKIREQVTALYFRILLLNENSRVLATHIQTLEAKMAETESGIRNGVVAETNHDILKAERIAMEQHLDQITLSKLSALQVMSTLTGLNLDDKTIFERPGYVDGEINPENNRPEFIMLAIQQKKLDATRKLSDSRLLPQLSAFGQAGYGRPGYDMLKNEFDDYYMIGARLKWNFWDWSYNRNEKKILGIQSKVIETRKETFTRNLTIDLVNKQAELDILRAQIARDLELIELREKISQSASSQMLHGIITASQYIRELNNASRAKLDLEVHQIELLQAQYEYKLLTGN